MGQRRNHRRNYKISWDKWKWEYNLPKLMGYHKNCSERKVYTEKNNVLRN